MVRDGFGADAGDVAVRTDTEVALVDLAGVVVDVAGEDAFEAGGGRRDVEAADAAEQVSESP